MAYSFLRNIRIRSNDTEMFNSFLTFSAADGHWNELHEKLPGSEEYLGKRVVKNLEDVEESERDNCIEESKDYELRKKSCKREPRHCQCFLPEKSKNLMGRSASTNSWW